LRSGHISGSLAEGSGLWIASSAFGALESSVWAKTLTLTWVAGGRGVSSPGSPVLHGKKIITNIILNYSIIRIVF